MENDKNFNEVYQILVSKKQQEEKKFNEKFESWLLSRIKQFAREYKEHSEKYGCQFLQPSDGTNSKDYDAFVRHLHTICAFPDNRSIENVNREIQKSVPIMALFKQHKDKFSPKYTVEVTFELVEIQN